MSLLFQAKSYGSYWLNAVDEHSLHSPFFFDFYQHVIKPKATNEYQHIERQRSALLKDDRTLTVQDLGAGSKMLKKEARKVKDIARTSLSPAKYAQLYARLIAYCKAIEIVELGTSFGINTQYLAHRQTTRVSTFEGSSEIAEVAEQNFQAAAAKNIYLIAGNIDHTLPHYLSTASRIDVAFMDANHRYAPTLAYYEMIAARMSHNGVIILDDIHQSLQMQDAWNELKKRVEIGGSIDLYRCGILFFDQSLNKQHVVIQY